MSKRRKAKEAVAVRYKLDMIVTKDPAGTTPEKGVDQIIGNGVRAVEWNGTKIPSDFVAAGDKYTIKLRFPSKDSLYVLREKYFPTDCDKKRSTKLKYKDDRAGFTCSQLEWHRDLFAPLWEMEGCDRGPRLHVRPASHAPRG